MNFKRTFVFKEFFNKIIDNFIKKFIVNKIILIITPIISISILR